MDAVVLDERRWLFLVHSCCTDPFIRLNRGPHPRDHLLRPNGPRATAIMPAPLDDPSPARARADDETWDAGGVPDAPGAADTNLAAATIPLGQLARGVIAVAKSGSAASRAAAAELLEAQANDVLLTTEEGPLHPRYIALLAIAGTMIEGASHGTAR